MSAEVGQQVGEEVPPVSAEVGQQVGEVSAEVDKQVGEDLQCGQAVGPRGQAVGQDAGDAAVGQKAGEEPLGEVSSRRRARYHPLPPPVAASLDPCPA